MKKEKKVLIISVLTLLQERDPAWKHPKMQRQFKCLYLGWRQAELRAKRHTGFFSQRNSKGIIPRDGHLKFIFTCAILAQANLHITDIKVSREELVKAVEEAGWCLSRFMENLHPTLTANGVLTFKQKVGL